MLQLLGEVVLGVLIMIRLLGFVKNLAVNLVQDYEAMQVYND